MPSNGICQAFSTNFFQEKRDSSASPRNDKQTLLLVLSFRATRGISFCHSERFIPAEESLPYYYFPLEILHFVQKDKQTLLFVLSFRATRGISFCHSERFIPAEESQPYPTAATKKPRACARSFSLLYIIIYSGSYHITGLPSAPKCHLPAASVSE